MKDFLTYQRRVLCTTAALAGVAAAILYLYWPADPSYLWGWVLGTVTGMVAFRVRVAALLRLPSLPQEEWGKAGVKTSLRIYALFAGVGLIAAGVNHSQGAVFSLWTLVGGFLLERVVLIADGLLRPGALAPNAPETDDTAAAPVEGKA